MNFSAIVKLKKQLHLKSETKFKTLQYLCYLILVENKNFNDLTHFFYMNEKEVNLKYSGYDYDNIFKKLFDNVHSIIDIKNSRKAYEKKILKMPGMNEKI